MTAVRSVTEDGTAERVRALRGQGELQRGQRVGAACAGSATRPHRVHEGDQLVQVRGRVPLDVVGGEAGRQAVGRQSLDARGAVAGGNPQRGPRPRRARPSTRTRIRALRALSITPTAPSSNSRTISALSPPAAASALTARTSPTSQRAQSMSWTAMSTNRLPSRSLRPPWGCSRLRCEIRSSCTSPTPPAATIARARIQSGSKRRWNPTCSVHAGRLSRAQRLAPAGQVERDRLLAEDVPRAQGGPSDHLGVERRRRRDHDRLDGVVGRAPLRGSATTALPALSPGCVRPVRPGRPAAPAAPPAPARRGFVRGGGRSRRGPRPPRQGSPWTRRQPARRAGPRPSTDRATRRTKPPRDRWDRTRPPSLAGAPEQSPHGARPDVREHARQIVGGHAGRGGGARRGSDRGVRRRPHPHRALRPPQPGRGRGGTASLSSHARGARPSAVLVLLPRQSRSTRTPSGRPRTTRTSPRRARSLQRSAFGT